MGPTTVVNLKGHRDDPGYADVIYVGRAMHRGGWQLKASALANPFRPGPDGSRKEVVGKYRDYVLTCWPCCPGFAGTGSAAGACPSDAMPKFSPSSPTPGRERRTAARPERYYGRRAPGRHSLPRTGRSACPSALKVY
jgi:hypothetical protein